MSDKTQDHICPHCNAKIEQAFSYCPMCGSSTTQNKENDPLTLFQVPPKPTQIIQKKKMPLWFKLVTGIAVLALICVTAGILFTENWVDVVDHQLAALKEHDINKAYKTYTSKDFQAATSLDEFTHFVTSYPVFLTNHSSHFTVRTIEHNIGTLRGNIISTDHTSTPIEYKLIRENGKWKILSIHLLKPGNTSHLLENEHIEEITLTVKNILKEIQEQKISEAYQNYTSHEFKEATSKEAFEEFIKRYPLLIDSQALSFQKPTIQNGVGTISVVLQSHEEGVYVKFYLIHEDKHWKIWNMRILLPSEKKEKKKPKKNIQTEAIQFGAIQLADHINALGRIEHPTTIFNKELSDLFVDIEIKGKGKGAIIYIDLKHSESNTTIPAKALVEEDDDSWLLSVFSPPHGGWLPGHYQIEAKTLSGQKTSAAFTIE